MHGKLISANITSEAKLHAFMLLIMICFIEGGVDFVVGKVYDRYRTVILLR
jgi:type III secretory pathway component EscT